MINTKEISDDIKANLTTRSLYFPVGRVIKVAGAVIHGYVPGAKVGDLCQLLDDRGRLQTLAEVVGFTDETAVLTPLADSQGISTKTQVKPLGKQHQIFVHEGLRGSTLDGMGRPLVASLEEAEPEELSTVTLRGRYMSVMGPPPNPLTRQPIDRPFVTGVKVIDSLLTVGVGQRVGLFAAPGVGKSTLLGSITTESKADTLVVALIGERGREVNDFVAKIPEDIRKRTILVVATSDRSPMERVKAAYVATTIAEYFRDLGDNVLFMMDSVTRFARSLRDVGLSAGETPTRRGYPASTYQALPKLLERTGNNDKGTITAFYTVLIEGDDMTDPIADEVSSLLDGQFILSRDMQQQGQYPAVDSLKSISRCMTDVISPDHLAQAQRAKDLMAKYLKVKLLVDIGEYKEGQDSDTDLAIQMYSQIMEFLKQQPKDNREFEETLAELANLVG